MHGWTDVWMDGSTDRFIFDVAMYLRIFCVYIYNIYTYNIYIYIYR